MSSNDESPAESEPTDRGALQVAMREARLIAASEFERLYAVVVPTLVTWTHLRVAGLPHGRIEVEDIVQETWSRALQNFDRLSDPNCFRQWVIGIAQNVLLETLRRDARGRNQRPTGQDATLSQCPDSVTSISRAAARDDGFRRLLALIFELSDEDRKLVLMHGLEERSLATIAVQMEISAAAAEKRWQRLRARLSEQPAFVALMVG